MAAASSRSTLRSQIDAILAGVGELELFCTAYYPHLLGEQPGRPSRDELTRELLNSVRASDVETKLRRWQAFREDRLPREETETGSISSNALQRKIPMAKLHPKAPYAHEVHIAEPLLENKILSSLREKISINLVGGNAQGKTWWVQHILFQLKKEAGVRTVHLDLASWSPRVLEQNELLFSEVRRCFMEQLHVSADELPGQAEPATSLRDAWRVLQAYLRRPECINLRLVVAIDGTDRLLENKSSDDFFSPLRALLQDPPGQICMLLALSVPPVYAIHKLRRSRLNLGDTHGVPDFNREQVKALAQTYGCVLSEEDELVLWRLLSGHPYLVRTAFYLAVNTPEVPLTALLEEAACSPDGGQLFRNTLEALRQDLTDAQRRVLRKVYTEPGQGANEEELFWLRTQGLIVSTERSNRDRLHCRLYLHLLQA